MIWNAVSEWQLDPSCCGTPVVLTCCMDAVLMCEFIGQPEERAIFVTTSCTSENNTELFSCSQEMLRCA